MNNNDFSWFKKGNCSETGVGTMDPPSPQAAGRKPLDNDPAVNPRTRIDVQEIVRKRFCTNCSVTEQCLLYAIANNEVHGVWGNMNEQERAIFVRDQKKLQNA